MNGGETRTDHRWCETCDTDVNTDATLAGGHVYWTCPACGTEHTEEVDLP